MAQLPNRLTALVDKLSSGEGVTKQDLETATTLMDFDIAIYGRQVVEEAIERTRQADALLAQPRGV